MPPLSYFLDSGVVVSLPSYPPGGDGTENTKRKQTNEYTTKKNRRAAQTK